MVAKLTDVAKRAGVSPTTVSRVINRKGYLSEKTIHKVEEAMQELGYKPNNLARSLQGKSSRFIGLIFPNVSNIFYAELINSLEIRLFEQGYKAILCNSEKNPSKEREYLQMLDANQVDGIISGSHNLGIEDYRKVDAPIISFDRNLAPDIPIVSSDNFEGGRLAAKTLRHAGVKHPIIISGRDDSGSPTKRRGEGFRDVLPETKIIHIPGDYSPIRKKMELQMALRKEKPDGLFASDDTTALLAMQIIDQAGFSVPDDIKIIGYDGTAMVTTYFPRLTTIQQPIAEIAQVLVEVLLKKINHEPVDAEYILPVSLLPGKSI